MTKSIAGWDLAEAISDPPSMFMHPEEVLRMGHLSKRDKIDILESWKSLEEQEAQFSGQTRKPARHLAAIEAAMKKVD